MKVFENFENELTRFDEFDTLNKPAQKPKRGRKMTMTTKDNDAMCTTIEESTTILSENSQSSLNENWQKTADGAMRKSTSNSTKKSLDKSKKRGRKSVPNAPRQETNNKTGEIKQHTATASTSDEDEECSAHDCVRPQGL